MSPKRIAKPLDIYCCAKFHFLLSGRSLTWFEAPDQTAALSC